MIRRPPRSTLSPSSAASDVYKRQLHGTSHAREREQDTYAKNTMAKTHTRTNFYQCDRLRTRRNTIRQPDYTNDYSRSLCISYRQLFRWHVSKNQNEQRKERTRMSEQERKVRLVIRITHTIDMNDSNGWTPQLSFIKTRES